LKTDGDFRTGIGGENSTGKSTLITVSTEWPFPKPERNETDEQRSAVLETAIECVTG
jgi:ATPase subunit of ABC transporter with duplicated ATPase domains